MPLSSVASSNTAATAGMQYWTYTACPEYTTFPYTHTACCAGCLSMLGTVLLLLWPPPGSELEPANSGSRANALQQ
jgi:hypothetical protein